MTESMLAVEHGPYTFDYPQLVASVQAQWPGTRFIPEESVNGGQLQIGVAESGTEPAWLLIELLSSGSGIGFEGHDVNLAAEFIAQVTNQPGFPDDRSVVAIQWTEDLLPLYLRLEVALLVESATLWR